MDNKNSFKLYTDYQEIFDKLTDAQAGQLIKAILAHENGMPYKLDGLLEIIFIPIRQQLDRNRVAYEEKCNTNRENGALGGRPSKQADKSKTHKNRTVKVGSGGKPKKPDTDTDTETDTETDIDTGTGRIKKNAREEETPPPPPEEPPFPESFQKQFRDPELARAVTAYERIIQKPIPEIAGKGIIDYMDDGLSAEMIEYACQIASAEGIPKWSYIEAILGRFRDEHLTTVDEVIAAEKRRKNSRPTRMQKYDPALDYSQRVYAPGELDKYFEEL